MDTVKSRRRECCTVELYARSSRDIREQDAAQGYFGVEPDLRFSFGQDNRSCGVTSQ